MDGQMSDRIRPAAPICAAVMPTIFASALYDAGGEKLWANRELVDDKVDELVILTNEQWLDILSALAEP